jgi:hypothetical protein
MDSYRDFWLDIGDEDHEDLVQVSEAVVQAAAQRMQVRFPPDLTTLLITRNGGTPRRRAFTVPEEQHDQHSIWLQQPLILDEILRLDEIEQQTDFIWQFDYCEGLVQFAICRGGYVPICLDCREDGSDQEPAVVCCAPDYDECIASLAPSLAVFLSTLFLSETRDCYGIECERSAGGDLWEQIVSLLDLRNSESVEDEDYGPSFAAVHGQWTTTRLGNHAPEPATLHLAWNEDDAFYIGFPDHPECSWTLRLDGHPRHRTELEEKLRSLPYRTRPLHLVDWSKWNTQYGL